MPSPLRLRARAKSLLERFLPSESAPAAPPRVEPVAAEAPATRDGLRPLRIEDVVDVLADPMTHEPLALVDGALSVVGRARRYPVREDVACLHRSDAIELAAPDEAVPPPSRRRDFPLVLDIGTKTGKGVVRARKEHAKRLGFRKDVAWGVVGIDLHHARVVQTKAFGIAPVKGDATRLPFADGAFDLTVMTELLEHIPRELAVGVLREARRVSRRAIFIQNPDFSSESYLREKGLKFTWMDWKVHPHHITADDMRAMLAEAGFTGFEVEQIRPVADSSSAEIVSLDTPRDTQFFDPAIHHKPHVVFDRPVFEKLRVVLRLDAAPAA